MPQFSVIVPVYKVEQYLKSCVDAVLSQSFTNFELILVNDGSPDRCGTICDQYAQKDHRVKVIHQENGGVSAARNRGLEAAIGRYVAFVDADDLVPADFLENAYSAIQEYPEAEIVQFAWRVFEEGNDVSMGASPNPSLQRHETASAMRDFLNFKTFTHAPWGKVIHRDLLQGISFPVGIRVGEDLHVSYQLLGKAQKIISTDAVGYWYCIREGSTMTSRAPGAVADALWVFGQMYDYYQREFPALRREAACRYANDMMQLLRDLNSMDSSAEKTRVKKSVIAALKTVPEHLLTQKTVLLKQLALKFPPLYFLLYKMSRQ